MISFPNAKINLGLHVLFKRPEGYHAIESCLYPVLDLCDILEINQSKKLEFKTSGLSISGNLESNIVLKAYNLLKNTYKLPPISIHLHKIIPTGAGLGGGSSDGAFALKMINEIFNLDLSKVQLETVASQLGSDCPFFIENTPMIATGTGTQLEKFDLNLNEYKIRLKHPNIHISTKEAYKMITCTTPKNPLKSILKDSINNWQIKLKNNFEAPMVARYPRIGQALEELKKQGATYAAMTGSGSSVFGLFKT